MTRAYRPFWGGSNLACRAVARVTERQESKEPTLGNCLHCVRPLSTLRTRIVSWQRLWNSIDGYRKRCWTREGHTFPESITRWLWRAPRAAMILLAISD